jgi:hypothetical protein
MYGNETADPGAAYWTAVVLQCIAPTTPLLNVALFFRANRFLLFRIFRRQVFTANPSMMRHSTKDRTKPYPKRDHSNEHSNLPQLRVFHV